MTDENAANPVLIEVARGDIIESAHRAAAIVLDRHEQVLASWGDIDKPFFPRSSLKLIHALPLIETGAADAFGLDEQDIVLAAASHSGDPIHTERIASWLSRLGLNYDALLCGSHIPFSEKTALQLACDGVAPNSLHNNNSGKHLGFLTTALHLAEPVSGYLHPDHPVQRRVRAAVERVTLARLSDLPQGLERCGMPMWAISLRRLAAGMIRFGTGRGLSAPAAEAASRITAAIRRYPELLTGARRLPCLLSRATAGNLIVKGGSEGSYSGFVEESGIGFALKIDDGSGRAADVLLLAILRLLGLREINENAELRRRSEPVVTTAGGKPAGRISPSAQLSALHVSH